MQRKNEKLLFLAFASVLFCATGSIAEIFTIKFTDVSSLKYYKPVKKYLKTISIYRKSNSISQNNQNYTNNGHLRHLYFTKYRFYLIHRGTCLNKCGCQPIEEIFLSGKVSDRVNFLINDCPQKIAIVHKKASFAPNTMLYYYNQTIKKIEKLGGQIFFATYNNSRMGKFIVAAFFDENKANALGDTKEIEIRPPPKDYSFDLGIYKKRLEKMLTNSFNTGRNEVEDS
jgi:hypothetical protein